MYMASPPSAVSRIPPPVTGILFRTRYPGMRTASAPRTTRMIPVARSFPLDMGTGEVTMTPGAGASFAGVAAFLRDGRPPFMSPMGKKSIPKARNMLEVPWAAPGSGLGIRQ